MDSDFKTPASKIDALKKAGLISVLLIILAIGAYNPLPIKLKDFDQIGFQTLIASLLIVSLFLERGVEVFVATWKAPGAEDIRVRRLVLNMEMEHLKADLQEIEESINQKKQSNQPSTEDENKRRDIVNAINQKALEICKNEQRELLYASETKRFALYFALGAGMLISAVGIRILTVLTDIEQSIGSNQRMAFQLVDIALTGGLLAGGSEAFHRIANLYNTLMDSTTNKVGKLQPAPQSSS